MVTRAPQRFCKECGEPIPKRRHRGIAAEHADLAAVTRAIALEDLDRRRLAGAVGPEKPEDLAVAHL
jgi:hypothetical protein